MEVMFFLNE